MSAVMLLLEKLTGTVIMQWISSEQSVCLCVHACMHVCLCVNQTLEAGFILSRLWSVLSVGHFPVLENMLTSKGFSLLEHCDDEVS